MASLVLLVSELLRPDDANLLAADCFRSTRRSSAACDRRHAGNSGPDAEEKPVLLRFYGKREDVGVVEDPMDAKFSVDDCIWP